MKKALLLAIALVLLAVIPAGAGHEDDPRTRNLHPMGHIVEPASLLNSDIGNPNIHTDIAFWGKYAFQGSWLGFNIRDISEPDNPQQVSFTSCTGDQGDIVVWENVLVRSWNSPASMGSTCDGELVPEGFEGLHVFDISDVNDPLLVGSVDLSNEAIPGRCGSHTATVVPDLDNDRLLIYNSGSQCEGFDVVEVPLSDPPSATYIRTEPEPTGRPCHDTSVILGEAMLAACAGGDGYAAWTLTGDGTLEDPAFLYNTIVPGVNIGHMGSFTWDGEVYAFGHEPGGGVEANCQEANPDSDKSVFFFNARTGEQLGMWTLPRPQSDIENCSIHNFNSVPTRTGSYVLVIGNYQAGTWVVDFTDPANAETVAWSDPPPAPVPPPPGDFLGLDIVGAWSSYWYNGFIYETNIGEGLNIFRLSDRSTASAMRLDHLNPQTQEFTIP